MARQQVQKLIAMLDEAYAGPAWHEARSLASKGSWVHPRALFFDASRDFSEGNWKRGLEKLDAIERDFSLLLNQPDIGRASPPGRCGNLNGVLNMTRKDE
jgi:hypothetical protein